MEIGNNAICGVCSKAYSQWICQCQNIGVCPKCIETHLSKTQLVHVLVDKNNYPGIQELLRPLSDAMSVNQFIDDEITWMRQREQELRADIDTNTERMKSEVHNFGLAKQEELHCVTEEIVQKLTAMKDLRQKEEFLQVKAANGHMFALSISTASANLAGSLTIAAEQCVRLRDENQQVRDPVPAYRPIIEESRFQLGTLKPGRLWEGRGKVDAVTLQLSKAVNLLGISIGKQKEISQPVALEMLQVLQGNTTRGTVLYSHPRIYPLESTLPDRVLIRFNQMVPMNAQTNFTVKVQLRGKVFCTGQILSSRMQNYLEVAYERPIFAGGDQDNGSSEESGVFFELLYCLP